MNRVVVSLPQAKSRQGNESNGRVTSARDGRLASILTLLVPLNTSLKNSMVHSAGGGRYSCPIKELGDVSGWVGRAGQGNELLTFNGEDPH